MFLFIVALHFEAVDFQLLKKKKIGLDAPKLLEKDVFGLRSAIVVRCKGDKLLRSYRGCVGH